MVNMFRRNLGVKIISVLFAVLFWLFVLNEGTPDKIIPEQTLTITLVASGLQPDMVVMTQLPDVRVRLRGINPSANIKNIYAEVDLSGGVPGESTYAIKVNTPTGTNVVDLQPANIKLTLDNVQEKTIPVEAIISGNPANDFQVANPMVKPSAVNVRGPSTILSTLDRVIVEVNVTGVNDTVQLSRPVSFRDKEGKPIFGPNPSLEILNAYPSSVDVIVPVIAKAFSTKMVPLRATSQGTPASGKELRSIIPSQVSVTLIGSAQALKGIESVNLGPVDINNLSEDQHIQIPINKVTLPAGVSLLSGTSLSVFVQIGDGPIQKSISDVAVKIRNIGSDLEVDTITSPIEVVVEGLADVVNNLTSEQIELWVDASDQGAGSYANAKVYWQLPPGITIPTTLEVDYSLKALEAKGVE